MARNGDPDDEFYSEPTQYADYRELGASGQAYSEVPPQPDYPTGFGYPTGDHPQAPEPEPWYRKPAALVGLGAAGVVIAALVIYALVSLFGGSDNAPTGTTTTVTTTPETTDAGQTPVAPPPQTETVTETPTTTAPAETTSEAPTVSTVTETETATETVTPTRTRPTWTLPTLPRGDADSGQ